MAVLSYKQKGEWHELPYGEYIVPTKLGQLENDTGFIAEDDIHDWAKQPEKPKYTADEVGAATTEYVDNAIKAATSDNSYTEVVYDEHEKDYLEAFLEIAEAGKYKAEDGCSINYCEVIVEPNEGTIYHKITSYNNDGTVLYYQYVNGVLVLDCSSEVGGATTFYSNLNVIKEPTQNTQVANKGYVDKVIANLPTGNSDKWEFIGEFNVGDEDVSEWIISEDAEGKPIELKLMYIERNFLPSATTTKTTKVYVGNPAVTRPFNTNCYFYEPEWLTTTAGRHSRGCGVYIDYLPHGDEFLMRATQMVSLLSSRTTVGRSEAGGETLKKCIAGLAMRSANAETGLFGAGSTIKMWGVRM